METEAGCAEAFGVAMETGAAGSALEVQHHGERRSGTAAASAARWDPRRHYLLIVIGDIATESQLQAVRDHLEHGERRRGCVMAGAIHCAICQIGGPT